MTKKIIDLLPHCYANFLPPFFEQLVPAESVTCSRCAMLEHHGSQRHASKFFSPSTKCCTHYPELPNYLVGALLSSTDATHETGRCRIKNKIAGGISITPLGVLRPKKFTLLLKNTSLDFFGRSDTLRCPFYETSGICSISPYWDAVCSTWFCKHNSGESGWRFWQALRGYLENLEKILSRYALLKIDAGLVSKCMTKEQPLPLTVQELDDLPPSAECYENVWSKWAGKETEFYKESYKVISELRQEDLIALEGIEQKILLQTLEKEYTCMMNAPMPERLRRKTDLSVDIISDSEYLLVGYSQFDPLKVSKRLYDCLDCFNGSRTNQEVVEYCLEKHNIRLTEEIIRRLYQFQILITASSM